MNQSVLIVDDEPHILQSLKRLLRPDAYDVHLADGGPSALDALAKTQFAVIICDQRMPEMNGAQVLAEAYKLCPDTVRITLTGHTDLAAAQASINEGHVNQFLLKPWDDNNLRSVVAEAVRAYELVQENRRLEELTRRQKEELAAWNKKLEEQVRQRTQELSEKNKSLLDLQHRVERSLRDTVGILAAALEAHSPNLGIHCKRVAELSCQVISELGLGDEEARDVEFAAHLHDLGKISKLSGDGKASAHSGSASRTKHSVQHAEAGYAILAHVSGFERVAEAVKHQYERYDGTGYPDGLGKENIPLASRIIAIANAYDKAAFSTSDPTHISREAAHKTLQDGRDTRFEPLLVDLLLQSLDNLGASTENDEEVELSPKQIKPGMILSRAIHNHDGILLLKEGVELTAELIAHIRDLADLNPLHTDVFVRCTGEAVSISKNDASFKPPAAPPPEHHVSTPAAGESTALGESKPAEPKRGDQPQEREIPEEGQPDSCPSPFASDSQPPPTPVRPRGTVLLVDDSVLVCNALRRELRTVGIEIVATESGWNALDLVARASFDAVLVDLMMPAMPGEELIRRLQQCSPKLPCVILTGNATREHVLTLTKQPNVVGIMTKPWDHDRLISTISAAIGKSKPEPAKEPV